MYSATVSPSTFRRLLEGLLPICAWCKKIWDDKNNWQVIEQYVAAHTEARFSHGICPDCLQQNFKKMQTDVSAL